MSSSETIQALGNFDSPTIFNAVVEKLGLPNEDYTSHEIRCLSPGTGTIVGYAATAEVTTNDPDSPALPWPDYYEYLEQAEGPLIALMKDVDSRPGRGASFGDGMAAMHQRLGVVAALVAGTVRDLAGIHEVGLPIWAWGTVPGHGKFNLTRFDAPVTIAQLRVSPGDLLVVDADGAVRVPVEHADEIAQIAADIRRREATNAEFTRSPDFSVAAMRERGRWNPPKR